MISSTLAIPLSAHGRCIVQLWDSGAGRGALWAWQGLERNLPPTGAWVKIRGGTAWKSWESWENHGEIEVFFDWKVPESSRSLGKIIEFRSISGDFMVIYWDAMGYDLPTNSNNKASLDGTFPNQMGRFFSQENPILRPWWPLCLFVAWFSDMASSYRCWVHSFSYLMLLSWFPLELAKFS